MADEPAEGAKLTPLGKILSVVVILALLGLGGWVVFKKSTGGGGGGGTTNTTGGGGPEAPKPEAPDTKGVTTVTEYKYIPADKLPPVKGVSQYKWDANQK